MMMMMKMMTFMILFLLILYYIFQLSLYVAYVIVDDDDDDDDDILDTFSCDSFQSISVIIVCCVCDCRIPRTKQEIEADNKANSHTEEEGASQQQPRSNLQQKNPTLAQHQSSNDAMIAPSSSHVVSTNDVMMLPSPGTMVGAIERNRPLSKLHKNNEWVRQNGSLYENQFVPMSPKLLCGFQMEYFRK